MLKKLPILFAFLFGFCFYLCAQESNNNISISQVRNQKWIEDLQFFKKEFLKKSTNFPEDSVNRFNSILDSLLSRVDVLSDNQILMGISECITLTDNGHNTFYFSSMTRLLPIRFYWFSDGLYIVKTAKEYKQYLGYRIIKIGNTNIDDALTILKKYISGKDNWVKFKSTTYLASPDILEGIGLSKSSDSVKFILQDKQNDQIELWVSATNLKDNYGLYHSWKMLFPNLDSDTSKWTQILKNRKTLPLYLSNPNKTMFYHFVDSLGVLYIQLNATYNGGGAVISKLKDTILNIIKTTKVRSVVSDFRFNAGGNYLLTVKLSKKLGKKFHGKIYIVTSNSTFSAGLVTTARLKYFAKGKAILVGEPVGDRLKFWAEGKSFRLKNHDLRIQTCPGYHDWQDNKHKLFKTFFFNRLFGVPAKELDIDIPASNSFDDYLNGRDNCLDKILKAESSNL